MKKEDFKIDQFHFGTNCIALCMCFLASKLGLKFETPPSWAQIWACDWVRSQVELVCEMHWVWVHRLSKIFPKFETKSQLLSLTQGLSLFMKPAPGTSTHTEWWKREATMGFLTIFYKYIIQQYFTVTAPTASSQYLQQIKYKMLVLVHPQSDENVRLRWGF